MRGLAAVLVLLDHSQRLFLVDRDVALRSGSHATGLFYTVTSGGLQAVNLFFVLSGYLISKSVFGWLAADRWSWRRYLAHRLVRLWLVLVPALVLGVGWDALRIAHAGGVPGLLNGLALHSPANRLTWRNFFGSLLFLQTIHTNFLGSNRVLWSLACEFWYYLLFATGLFALRRKTPSAHRVAYGVAFLGLSAFVGIPVLSLFPVWLLGTLLACLPPPTVGRTVRWIAAVLYAPLIFLLPTWPWYGRWFKEDYLLGVLNLVFLWVLLSARNRAHQSSTSVVLSRWLASFSYSLYLVHYPLLACVATWLPGHPWLPNMPHLVAAAACLILIMMYAYGVASVTELKNDAVRDRVERGLNLQPESSRGSARLSPVV